MASKKRGSQPDKLSVRLFLLDPDKEVTKVTKEMCSKDEIKRLMQDGYGPPKPEHCKGDESVEFSFQLTNEHFKQKLAEIYPHLEDACFVFMTAGRDNRLEELNKGGCCYRCYTPENVYLCERGQGRLYIRKITENEISSCTHGMSHSKRPCPILPVLTSTTVEHESIREGPTTNTRDSTTPSVQQNEHLPEPIEFPVDEFLENVQTTKSLEISLSVLNNDDLLKKLKESAINIHTIEIQSTCKLDRVLKSYDFPPVLKVLRINDNFLNYEEIFALVRSLNNVDCLHELELSRTRFEGNSFICFLSVLMNCGDLQKLSLSDNGLTEQERNCLTHAFVSMTNLTALNLSESNLTGTQANNILQKLGGKNIFTLDLSQNALQGSEIIIGLCQIQSLEEINLSHNHIKFFPLPVLGQERANFPVNTTKISLSSNHMMPKDISLFCSLLIRSDLLELNLDFNHVGISVRSLCSLRINHLKVLSLENTDICGDAVDGLGLLLSLVRELEELNLSSNNLMLNDFRHLQSALSNLTHLRKLNLSNIPEISFF